MARRQDRGRGLNAWKQARARRRAIAQANDEPCGICGAPIDYTLQWPDPRSCSIDHIHELAKGGQLLGETRPAHLSCNSRRSNLKTKPKRLKKTTLTPSRTSREW